MHQAAPIQRTNLHDLLGTFDLAEAENPAQKVLARTRRPLFEEAGAHRASIRRGRCHLRTAKIARKACESFKAFIDHLQAASQWPRHSLNGQLRPKPRAHVALLELQVCDRSCNPSTHCKDETLVE